jgi:orotate phosphoribosyltransferase
MSWEKQKEEMVTDLTPRLYDDTYIESIFQAREEKHEKEGWHLKKKRYRQDGDWSPWFLNLRPIGASPRLLADIGYALGLMFENEMPECNKILGVEMAGIPIATATSMVSLERRGVELPFAYTRPLEKKVRNPIEALNLLNEMMERCELTKYGEKNLIEGRLRDGDNVAVWDDMVTDIGSKLIARLIFLFEAERLGLKDAECYHAAALLDREQGEGAVKAGLEYDKSTTDPKPQKICMHTIIPWRSKGLDICKPSMHRDEHELILDYSMHEEKYQRDDVIEYVLTHKKAYRPGQS